MASFLKHYRPVIPDNDALRKVMGARIESHSRPGRVSGHLRGRSDDLRPQVLPSQPHEPGSDALPPFLITSRSIAMQRSPSDSNSEGKIEDTGPPIITFKDLVPNYSDPDNDREVRQEGRKARREAIMQASGKNDRVMGVNAARKLSPPQRRRPPILPVVRHRREIVVRSPTTADLKKPERNSRPSIPSPHEVKGDQHSIETRSERGHRPQDTDYKYTISQDDTINESERMRRRRYALTHSSSAPGIVLHASRDTGLENKGRAGAEADKASTATRPFDDGPTRPRLNASGSILNSNSSKRGSLHEADIGGGRCSKKRKVEPREPSARDLREHRLAGYYR